jgi:predicted metal-dependent RNase
VHGDEDVIQNFADNISNEFKIDIAIPNYQEEFRLE